MKKSRNLQIKNSTASLLMQGATILYGFILPRHVLLHYGSAVNGLVNSISQLQNFILMAELGIGAVLQSALYGPLVRRDMDEISRIMTSGKAFFRKIALFFASYTVLLIAFYPQISGHQFPWRASALLIGIMSLPTFVHYWIDHEDRILLISDQRGYIVYLTGTGAIIINTFTGILLIQAGCSIYLVRLAYALVSLGRIFLLRAYTIREYPVNYHMAYEKEPIRQKWNGIAQHVAYIILENTDIAVLTIFSTLENVSVYSVYNMVVLGLKKLLSSLTSPAQPRIGELWARGSLQELNAYFEKLEWLIHFTTVVVFSSAGVLILPFIRIYTSGVSDADYIQPQFAALIVLAHGVHCLRAPYDKVILAAGHFRQTQRCYILASAMNLLLSITAVKYWGIIGVIVGTLVSMTFQTIWEASYDAKVLLNRSQYCFWFHILADTAAVSLILLTGRHIPLPAENYFSWTILAAVTTLTAASITAVVFSLFRFIQSRLFIRK